VGSALLIGREPVLVPAINGAVLTVEWYVTAYPFMSLLPAQPGAAHVIGPRLTCQSYADPGDIIASCALRPWTRQRVSLDRSTIKH
jgi:hypothetical protein